MELEFMFTLLLFLNFMGSAFGMQQSAQSAQNMTHRTPRVQSEPDVRVAIVDINDTITAEFRQLSEEIDQVPDRRIRRILKFLNNRDRLLTREAKNNDRCLSETGYWLTGIGITVTVACFVSFWALARTYPRFI